MLTDVTRRPESEFLRSLWAPLQEDARREVELSLKVAYALDRDIKHDEIAARLGVGLGDVKAAAKRLATVRKRLEQGD